MKTKSIAFDGMLIILILLENLFLYYFYNEGWLSQGANSLGLFLSSVLFGLLLLCKFYNRRAEKNESEQPRKIVSYSLLLCSVAGLVFFGMQLSAFFTTHHIDPKYSDIIPLIQVMCRRMLNGGQFAYNIVTDFGYPLTATYLPAQWMPFTIAEVLHIDYRWIAFGAWGIAVVILCIRSMQIPGILLRAAVPLLLFFSYYLLQENKMSIIEVTVELLIAAYYMALIVGMSGRNGIIQGVTVALCMLSRYSLVLWLPLSALVLFAINHRKQLFTAAGTATAIILVVYVIPFLSRDWSIFYRGYKYYDISAIWEWTHLNDSGKPGHLFSGTGFAYFFYSHFPSIALPARIKLLQVSQIICSLLATVIMGIWFWFHRGKIDHKVFLMSSFKIYLAVFLFLFQVPYIYLMCVGNFVSVAIFCEQARYRLSTL